MRPFTLLAWLTALVIGMLALQPASTAKAWGTLVVAEYSCSYGRVTAHLAWSGSNPHAYVQYVEMSYTDNGWQPHTTTSAGPLHSSVNTFAWDGLRASTRHFLRFTQQFPDGSWDPSLTFRFDTPSCGVDGFTPTFLSHLPEGREFGSNPLPSSGSGSSGSTSSSQSADRDCAGGTGDNPVVGGPLFVGSSDPDNLDGDGDGIACE